MSLAKLVLPAQIKRHYDADAAAYIAAVEAADGQSLERGVKDAITEFVIGCKTRGIWGAINSCCLLSGARTLNGALIPLKGTAPTNFNSLFTNSDYSRETGLKGNGSSKYLNTNVAASSFPQNNFHFSLYISSLSSIGAQRTYMADTGRNMYRPISNNTLTQFNINASFGAGGGDLNMASSTGFCGLSRDNASNFTIRIGSRNRVANVSSVVESGNGTMRIFGRNGNNTMGEFSDGRIAFYSIGESVFLRDLDSLITIFLQRIAASLSTYQATDPDASSYIKRVELADGFVLESSVKQAIDNLVVGLKADGLWSAIKACCIMSGPKTVAGALTPLVGPSPQNFNFVESDYIRNIGLKAVNNGVKYLDSKRPNNADPQNNHHMCVYKTSSVDLNWFIASSNTGIGARGQASWALMTASRISSGSVDATDQYYNFGSMGLIGIARNNPNNYDVIGNNLTGTASSPSVTPSSDNVSVFARMGGGVNSNTGYRFSYYSIGEYLNLSLLDARLDTFMTALSNANI